MFDELIKQINKQLTGSPHVIVGISGFAGAGKTYLANKLAKHYAIDDGQVIHLDNIYTPLPRGAGIFDDYDWQLLHQIVEGAKNGNDLDYKGTGFDGVSYSWRFKKKLPRVLIVEGIVYIDQRSWVTLM